MAKRRQKLLPWLENLVQSGKVEGLQWCDVQARKFQIPWKHHNKHDWNPDDINVFEEWAKETGRYRPGIDEPEHVQWKQRLRNALRKAPGIEEIPNERNQQEPNPYRVYQFTGDSYDDSNVSKSYVPTGITNISQSATFIPLAVQSITDNNLKTDSNVNVGSGIGSFIAGVDSDDLLVQCHSIPQDEAMASDGRVEDLFASGCSPFRKEYYIDQATVPLANASSFPYQNTSYTSASQYPILDPGHHWLQDLPRYERFVPSSSSNILECVPQYTSMPYDCSQLGLDSTFPECFMESAITSQSRALPSLVQMPDQQNYGFDTYSGNSTQQINPYSRLLVNDEPEVDIRSFMLEMASPLTTVGGMSFSNNIPTTVLDMDIDDVDER